MTSTTPNILIGLALGVATGLFLGEKAEVFQLVAEGYLRLLQMAVLPYVMVSLIEGRRMEVDGVVFPAERGSYYTLLYPAFSVAVPHPLAIRFPLAHPVGRRDLEFARFLGIWIDLQRKNETIQELYDHWILGRGAQPKQPRWSVIRNVLHWVD